LTVQSSELESVLAHIHNTLPYTARWIAVITVDATVMGYCGLENAEEDRVTALLAVSEDLHSRISNELNNGAYRYSVVGAEKGIYLVIALGEVGVLGINFDQITSFDKIFQMLPQAIAPLLKLLNLK
jgi:predicted regulator of Ras-like GTPase activity (Roadblock/LC7/MglB family)